MKLAALVHWYQYAKLHVGLVASVAVWASTNYPDTPFGHYAVLLVGVLGAVGLWAAPKEKKPVATEKARKRLKAA